MRSFPSPADSACFDRKVIVGYFCTSRKFGLRKSLSRISTRVSTEAASMVASSETLDGSAESNFALPLTLVNAPRTVETPRCFTENWAEECAGSNCQVFVCATVDAVKARAAIGIASRSMAIWNKDERDIRLSPLCVFSVALNCDALDGLYRNGQQIVDQPNFFLQERLRVSYAAKHAVKASHGVDPCANFVMGREEIFPGFLIAEQRFVGHDIGKLSLEFITDIDDKCWPNVIVKCCVNDLERPIRAQGRGFRADG